MELVRLGQTGRELHLPAQTAVLEEDSDPALELAGVQQQRAVLRLSNSYFFKC